VIDEIDAPTCAEKQRLLQVYEVQTTAFATAVGSLNRRMGTVSKVEYGELCRAVEEARLTSEHARLALEEHVANHGC
jgi:hypothetical protein